MKLALLKNAHSKFSVVEQLEEGLLEALLRLGHPAMAGILKEDGSSNLSQQIAKKKIDCTFGINQITTSLGVPHIYLGLDTIFWDDVEHLSDPSIVPCFVDPESASFWNRSHEKKAFWMPHACSLASAPQKSVKRDIPFFFPSSYIEERQHYLAWKNGLGEDVASEIVERVNRYLSDCMTAYIPFVEKVYEEVVRPYVPEGRDFFIPFSRSIDLFVRGSDRTNLMRRMEGETVHIATDLKGFQAYSERFPKVHFVYEGEKKFSELFPYFARSKCVLNSLPTVRGGVHERVLHALLFGASLYSTTLRELPSWMREAHIVSFYDQNDPFPKAPSASNWEKVRSWIAKNHTWDVRVQGVLQEAYEAAVRSYTQTE